MLQPATPSLSADGSLHSTKTRAGLPTRDLGELRQGLVSERLHFVEDGLGLRIALDLLDDLLLLRRVERSNTVEDQRSDRGEIVRRCFVQKAAELADVGSSHH